MEYRTFYNEGDKTCRIFDNLITKIENLDATECRRRCDYMKECKFFYHSQFSENTPCMIFKSCNGLQTMSRLHGTTYVKFRRGK